MPFQAPFREVLPARLQPQNLITPIVGGGNTPLNVASAFHYPDFVENMQKGLQMGSALAKLPREGAENALQKAYAQIQIEQAKNVQNQIKAIQADKSMDPAHKTAAIQSLLIQSGITTSPTGQSSSPFLPFQNVPGYTEKYLQGPPNQETPPQENTPPQKGAPPQNAAPQKSELESRADRFSTAMLDNSGQNNLPSTVVRVSSAPFANPNPNAQNLVSNAPISQPGYQQVGWPTVPQFQQPDQFQLA
jgi:hypothetical protein